MRGNNALAWLAIAVVLATGMTLILSQTKIPSYQDCLTDSQTSASAILCGLMGLGAVMDIAGSVDNNAQIEALTEKLEAAIQEKEAARERAKSLETLLFYRAENTEAFLDELEDMPNGADPIGADFFLRFNEAVCGDEATGGGCQSDGGLDRSPASEGVREASQGDT
jgi:hypothetical protein